MPVRTTLAAILAAALLLSPGGVAAQDDWTTRCQRSNRGHGRAVHCEQRDVRVAARSALAVDAGMNGGVEVEGWDRAGIQVQARVQAWAPTAAEARELARQVRIDTDGTLEAHGPSPRGQRGWAVSWHLRVPRRTALELETNNGGISVAGVGSRMRLRARNGPLDLSAVSGDVVGRTTNGPLNVTLAGSRWSGTGLDVETTNGPVVLRLPRGYSAELETGTVHGPIDVDLDRPLPVRGRLTRRLRTTLGEGGPPIRAVTTNGPVTLRDS